MSDESHPQPQPRKSGRGIALPPPRAPGADGPRSPRHSGAAASTAEPRAPRSGAPALPPLPRGGAEPVRSPRGAEEAHKLSRGSGVGGSDGPRSPRSAVVLFEPGTDITTVRRCWAQWKADFPTLRQAWADMERLSKLARNFAARDTFLATLASEYGRFDAVFGRAVASAHAADAKGALNALVQLAGSARAHRLLALWLAGEAFRTRTEVALCIAPLERLRFWNSAGGPLEDLMMRVGQGLLPQVRFEQPRGDAPVVARFASATCFREAILAELLSCGAVGTNQSWQWSETVYFDTERFDRSHGNLADAPTLHWNRAFDPQLQAGDECLTLTPLVAQRLCEGQRVALAPPLDKLPMQDYSPVLWETRRSLILWSQGMWIEWDSDIVMRSAVQEDPEAFVGGRVFQTTESASVLLFPHDVITVYGTTTGGRLPPLLERAFQSPSFSRVPDQFDEYVLGATVLYPRQHRQPPAWVSTKEYERKEDWFSLLELNEDVSKRSQLLFGRRQPGARPAAARPTLLAKQGWLLQENNREEDADAAEGPNSDPAMYWVNERTFLAWMPSAMFLANSGVQLLGSGSAPTQIAGLIMAPFSIVVMVYALVRFLLRNRALFRGQGIEAFGVIDRWGPWILLPLLCAVQVVLVVLALVIG